MAFAVLLIATAVFRQEPSLKDATHLATERLVARHGESHRQRVDVGVTQVARLWKPQDGTSADFVEFCSDKFVPDTEGLHNLFLRLQSVLQLIDGNVHEIQTELLLPYDVEGGPYSVIDDLLASVDLSALAQEELFRSKAAFVALLNFPVHKLSDRANADNWNRESWARSRMMDRFMSRAETSVSNQRMQAYVEANDFIAKQNLYTSIFADQSGERLYLENRRLSVHWGVRDEIKALYRSDNGTPKQEALFKAMERSVTGDVPASVIDSGSLRWCPETNEVFGDDSKRQADARYAKLLSVFQAERAFDGLPLGESTFLLRRFNTYCQMTEAEVENLLIQTLKAPEAKSVATLIQKRLGRTLRPYDIWYSDFSDAQQLDEAALDAMVKTKFPNVQSFALDLPKILCSLGFEEDKASWLASRIIVEPSRGAGHALAPVRLGQPARLRTRFEKDGMDYKSFNIAIHELGHCVEQVFSLYGIDHWSLRGVPNEAFTEALAFLFQYRDLELLGLKSDGHILQEYWSTYGTAGTALVDMRVWRWMYAHPDASPSDLRLAFVEIAKDVWTEFFVPVLGDSDTPILGIYSHLVANGLYMPDYVLGRVAAHQLAKRIYGNQFGTEFERVARTGRVTPDQWMKAATGQSLSIEPMLAEVRLALTYETLRDHHTATFGPLIGF